MLNLFKKHIKKIDDVREFTENLIAAGLEKMQGNKNIDDFEKMLVGVVIKSIEVKTGMKLPEEVEKQIQDGVVSGLNKANITLVEQLRK